MTSRFAKSATTAKRFVILTPPVTGGTQCWIAHKQLARSAKLKWMIDMNIYSVNKKIVIAASTRQAISIYLTSHPTAKAIVAKPWSKHGSV